MRHLSVEILEAIHSSVLNPAELAGKARDKSLEATLARVQNRLIYGMIDDIFHLAALYAMVIARGHCFNDGNKRTAFKAMEVCLEANDISLAWNTEEVGDKIILVAQGILDDVDLAEWLRGLPSAP